MCYILENHSTLDGCHFLRIILWFIIQNTCVPLSSLHLSDYFRINTQKWNYWVREDAYFKDMHTAQTPSRKVHMSYLHTRVCSFSTSPLSLCIYMFFFYETTNLLNPQIESHCFYPVCWVVCEGDREIISPSQSLFFPQTSVSLCLRVVMLCLGFLGAVRQ